MSCLCGPDIVTNGLILHIDSGNTKCFVGEPTVNLFTAPTPDSSNDVTFERQGTGTFKRIFGGVYGGYTIKSSDVVYRYDLGLPGCHYHGNTISVTSGQTVTFSFDYFIDTSVTNYPETNYLANCEVLTSMSTGDTTPTIIGTWKRIIMTAVAASTGNAYPHLYPGGCNPSRLASSGFILYKNPQYEVKSYSTPYVNGTRSNTQALLDLTGNNTLTASSLTYASGNTFSFNGSSDYISLPNNIGYTTQFSVFAWFKKVGVPTGGYHIICGASECEISTNAGEIRAGLQTSDGRFVSDHGSGITDGNWHYVGFTYNGSSKKAYIDSVYAGQQTCTGTLTYSFPVRTIGTFGYDYFTNGYIPIYQFYNKELSQTEITQNFRATKGRFGL